jgi:hypothetical protein
MTKHSSDQWIRYLSLAFFSVACSRTDQTVTATAIPKLDDFAGAGGADAGTNSCGSAGTPQSGGTSGTAGYTCQTSPGTAGATPASSCVSFDPAVGTTIIVAETSASVTIPPNSYCSGNSLPTTPISVCVMSFSNEPSMPGYCSNGVVPGSDGTNTFQIRTLGAVRVQATKGTVPLQLAQNAGLPVTIPVPQGREYYMQCAMGQPDQSIWWYDATEALWRMSTNASPDLSATMCHFVARAPAISFAGAAGSTSGPSCPGPDWPGSTDGYWNCDIKVPPGGLACGGAAGSAGSGG